MPPKQDSKSIAQLENWTVVLQARLRLQVTPPESASLVSPASNGDPTATHQPTSTAISASLEATESGGDRLIRSNSAVPGCHFRMKEIVTYDDRG